MPWQVATSFLSYTATASSEQAGYEAAWLPRIDDHPLLRTYRSVDLLSQAQITCQFSGLTTISGILIQNMNVDKIRLTRSTDGVNYFDLNTGSATLTTKPVGTHWQYRRYCQLLSVQATHIQVRVPVQTALDGAGYYEVGSILFPVFSAWPRAPRPGMRERIVREYERAGNAVAKASEQRVELEMSLLLKAGLEPTLKTFAMLGEDDPVAIFENNGNSAEALLMRKVDTLDFERHRTHRVVSNIKLRELV